MKKSLLFAGSFLLVGMACQSKEKPMHSVEQESVKNVFCGAVQDVDENCDTFLEEFSVEEEQLRLIDGSDSEHDGMDSFSLKMGFHEDSPSVEEQREPLADVSERGQSLLSDTAMKEELQQIVQEEGIVKTLVPEPVLTP